ncbi:hypothetical protein A0J61_00689 [Choanephora cucurbitarum]|uniref:Uncharacterized protein n=1 Tax=Choanephora cucurbitarum TaxID=101091 RepID=A0A1C7NUW4_9FUNG|nr:hypothetical protein A0J61_00689 [Choanephora cucurbitarum]
MHLQSPLVQQYIQSITTENKQQLCYTSSLYSIESDDDDVEKEVSVFEKTYVSFPDLSLEEDSKPIEPDTSKDMTTPSSYQFKPIWMSA